MTAPENDCGIPHILEHVTLCGSKKYPVRDPFFKMMSRSVANYMNAWTASDFTMYPFATDNVKDLENLRSVYLDATFQPLLLETDFKQEGWRLEHEKVGDLDSSMIFKGVVYNEMKGAFSDSNSLFCSRLQKHLHQGTAYGFESGGDPQAITDLDYAALCKFQRERYHPSNARMYTYGNYPVEKHLAALDETFSSFQKSKLTSANFRATSLAPRRIQEHCQVEPMGDRDKQTKMSVSWLTNDTKNEYETFLMKMLSYLLLDGHASPMYKALIERNIGSDYSASTGYDQTTSRSSFNVGLQGIRTEDVEVVEKIIYDTLSQVKVTGFDSKRIDAAIHQIELGMKHKTANFGMGLTHGLMSGWMHGSDPMEFLQVNKKIEQLREDMKEPIFFAKLIDRFMLQNDKNKLVFVMSPAEGYTENLKKNEEQRLAMKLSKLTSFDKKRILDDGVKLAALQDKKQDLSCLPSLSLADIPKSIKKSSFSVGNCGTAKLQWQNAPTNGITYFNAIFDYAGLPEHLQSLMPLYTSALTSVGTKKSTAAELDERMRLFTGGVGAGLMVSSDVKSVSTTHEQIAYSGNALNQNVTHIWDLLNEIMTEANFDDHQKLKTLLLSSAAGGMNSLAESGHRYARMHAASGLTRAAQLHELHGGVAQVDMLNTFVTQDIEGVAQKMHEISKFLSGTGVSRMSVITSEDSKTHQVIRNSCEALQNRWSSSEIQRSNASSSLSPVKNTWIPLPFASSYTGMALPTGSYLHQDAMKLQVLAYLMTHQYLHREVREKGGAYGGGASYSALEGVFSWYSYRDPNPLKSVSTFSDAAKWAAGASNGLTEQQLEEAKLSLLGSMDAPISVRSEGMSYFKHGITDEMRQTRRDCLFSVTLQDVREAADKYLVTPSNLARTTVLGGSQHPVDTLDTDQWTIREMSSPKAAK